MHDAKSNDRRRLISGFSLIGVAAVFFFTRVEALLATSTTPSSNEIVALGFIALFSMVLMIGSVFGITQLLRGRADLAGLIGAGFTLFGWTVSTRISVIMQLHSAVERGVEGVPKTVFQSIFEGLPMLWVSLFPVGLTFPIGMIILGAALVYAAPVNRLAGVAMIVGGICFPMGRAAGIEWAYIVCDFLLAFSFAFLGWHIVKHRALWEGSEVAESYAPPLGKVADELA
jgi:hypothetical protein